MAFERVHTIWDYYDGPREGLADFLGQPHYYKNTWDEAADDWSPSYELVPIDEETLQLAMEQWAIWLAWNEQFHAGQVPVESHPGNGGKIARYDELEVILEARIPTPGPDVVTAEGKFEVVAGESVCSGRRLTHRSSARVEDKVPNPNRQCPRRSAQPLGLTNTSPCRSAPHCHR